MPKVMSVVRLHENAKLPTVAHVGDLGFDLYALEDTLLADMTKKVRTGISISLPGFGFKIFDRSSVSLKGIITCGGVIDESYRGEIFVNMKLLGDEFMSIISPYIIKAGDKIAQLVPFVPMTHFPVIEVEELPAGERGEKGYGSTGR